MAGGYGENNSGNAGVGSGPSMPTGGYTGNAGGGSPVFKAPAPRGTTPGAEVDPFNGPGAIDFNLMQPGESLQEGVDTSKDVFTGLKAFLFGTDTPDAKGNHGGLPVLGWGPIGAAGRFASEVVANTAGGILAIPGAAMGGLERIGTDDATMAEIEKEFNALPEDSLAKAAALERIENDKGLLDSGEFTAHGHWMAEAIQRHQQEELIEENPDLWTGAFRPTASLMDAVTNLFGVFGAVAKPVANKWAGLGTPGQEGRNRVEMIMAVGDGHAHFSEDKGIAGTGLLAGDPTTGLNAVEQTVYDMVSSGRWDQSDAQNFLASRGSAFSHSAAANIAGEVALDPLNLATLGAGSIAKIGSTGAKMVKALEESKALLNAARAANAQGEVGAAEKVIALEKAVKQLEAGVRTGAKAASTGSRDVLGRIATADTSGRAFRAAGRLYGGLEGTGFGKAAKITRTVIDPLHAVGGTPKAAAALDAGSRDVTRATALAHGELNHISNTRMLNDELGAGVGDQYLQGLAIYSGNALRRVAGRSYRATQMMMSDKGQSLMSKDWGPLAAVHDALGGLKVTALTQLEEEVGQFIKVVWSADDDANLARRMETLWGGRSADEWRPILAGMNGEQKSLFHAATYGSAVQQLHKVRALIRESGQAGQFADRLDDLILLNRQTLTDLGHEGILKRIADAPDDAARMAIIEGARHDYPQLRTYVVDHTSASGTVANFLDMMERIKYRLPAQVRNEERALMPEALREFDSLITPSANADEAVFTIGFRPKNEHLWGLEENADGVLREVTDPWMDQSSDIAGAYSPIREPVYNIAGVPIPGAKQVAAALDHGEAIGRMAMHGVTGKMVTTAARNKFVQKVSAKYTLPDGTPALTEGQVANIWKALMDKVEESENISSVKGLSEGAIWKATKGKGVIPKYAERAGMDSRRLLVDILDAYDGDIRTIGLTQKLSGRVKLMLGDTFLGNTAGQVSEHVWPLLKFRLNPFFQLQEKIEPWVLNAQRGASVALGTKPNALDRAAMDLYQNFADKNLIHIADNDISELNGTFALGKGLNAQAYNEGGSLRGWRGRLEGLTDIQGTKQLNMMRTWRKGLGKSMRAEWERTKPGEFDRMLLHHRATVGEVIDEDDFAVFMAHSNLAANGVFTKMVDGVPHMDFTNAILEGQWSAPQHLGEMMPLNLDYMAQRLALSDNTGVDMTSSMDIRRALAEGRITHEDIARELRTLGAHPDYIQRVESALRFSWPEFWTEAKAVFSMTDDEVSRLRRLFSGIAAQRGMTPTEYLSQVYAPHIARGTDGAIGSLGGIVEFVRAGGRTESIPDLARLRGIEGQSTVRDFYQQMGEVFVHHLDPSAKRAFLREMMGDANSPDSITDILDSWDANGATEALMDRIMNYMHGTPGTGAHTIPADATGIEAIRDLAAGVRERAGRPPTTTRAVYEDDIDLARRIAAAYEDMPEGVHIATPAELAERVSDQDLRIRAQAGVYSPRHRRPGAAGIPTNILHAQQLQVTETRDLFHLITKPKAEGGLGIKVKTSRSQTPYANADALRADLARGRLKVPRDGYWHPVQDATDLAMQRAVSDVFGYGQEAVQFGEHGAIMSAAAMYSDEARPSYLTDEFGGSAYEAHSTKVVEQAVERPTTVAEYETRFGRSAPERVVQQESRVSEPLSRSVGDGVRALDPDRQAELLGGVSDMRNQFPVLDFGRIDAVDLSNLGVGPDGRIQSAGAATITFPSETPTITMSTHVGWHSDPAVAALQRAQREAQSASRRGLINRNLPNADLTPKLVGNTPMSDFYHEWGHVLDHWLHKQGRAQEGILEAGMYGDEYESLSELIFQFRETGTARRMSRYGADTNDHPILSSSETVGELFDLAFNPEHSDFLMGIGPDEYGRMIDEEVQSYAMEFRRQLQELDIWKPDGVGPPPVNPHAGMTIGEANRGVPGVPAKGQPVPGYTIEFEADPLIDNVAHPGMRHSEVGQDIRKVQVRDGEGNVVGHVAISEAEDGEGWKVLHVGVEAAHTRKGIANWMYREMERQMGVALKPSRDQTDLGRALWAQADRPFGQAAPVLDTPAIAPAGIRAPRRIGPMPQDLADELTEKFLGNGRYAESNPDVARAAGYMRGYMRDAAAWTLENETASQYAHLFDQSSGMPVTDALPFNVTEAALWHGQTQMMATKWRDAFRLQYFAQNRSMLQRSINHPMFGLYPASYMWGKVGPEMVKFMALEPFGAKTGIMAYTLLDIQKAVTVQRQFDPEFDAHIEKMGHSAALGWLSYMLPATPWSVPASYPSWMRDMATQGLKNTARAEAGLEVNDTDFISPLNAVLKKTMPLTTQLPYFGRALEEVDAGLAWNQPEPEVLDAMPEATMVNPNEVPTGPGPGLPEPVSGLESKDILADTMRTLSELLGS